ncbi:hypothetical protein [Xenorhabdus vietnamensis]|uniref:hypothetical protein n=1 Tax=Xenorhabdus vietnamensis TaxID=351656 RepID=UPI001FC9095D|nr:hypothetical protein [Xenorhabdus vietnamensis]
MAAFDDPEEAKVLLIEQRDSDEALEGKRASNPVLDLCAALAFMGEPRGLEMGVDAKRKKSASQGNTFPLSIIYGVSRTRPSVECDRVR